MKKVMLLMLIAVFCSCSPNSSKNDCLPETLKIIEKYDRQIGLAEGNYTHTRNLQQEKNGEISRLNCEVDCLSEMLEIIERWDALIWLAAQSTNLDPKDLQLERDAELKRLNCH